MSADYVWQESTDDKCADQMVKIGANMTKEPFKTLLGISAQDAATWQAHAAELLWLQKTAIGDADELKQAFVAARDRLTHGPDSRPYVRPTVPTFAPPPFPSGVTMLDDSYDWANSLVKKWKTNAAFTLDLQRQMGLRVPASDAGDTQAEATARIKQTKMQSGAKLTVDVFKGGAPAMVVQLALDGAGFPAFGEGGKYEKILPGSRFEFQLPPGVAHSVSIRCAFVDRQGNMIGDWSEVKTVSTLA